MPPAISVVVSTLALTISMVTAWLTLFRRGTVRMTRPTAIYFGADGSVDRSPKVYLRTLLYSTAKRGQIVESMFVKLCRGESIQTFNIWVYGEASNSPTRRCNTPCVCYGVWRTRTNGSRKETAGSLRIQAEATKTTRTVGRQGEKGLNKKHARGVFISRCAAQTFSGGSIHALRTGRDVQFFKEVQIATAYTHTHLENR